MHYNVVYISRDQNLACIGTINVAVGAMHTDNSTVEIRDHTWFNNNEAPGSEGKHTQPFVLPMEVLK